MGCLKEYTILHHFLNNESNIAYVVAHNTEEMKAQMYPSIIDMFTCKLARDYE